MVVTNRISSLIVRLIIRMIYTAKRNNKKNNSNNNNNNITVADDRVLRVHLVGGLVLLQEDRDVLARGPLFTLKYIF